MSAVLAILGGALFALAHPTVSWIQPYVNELWALPGAFLLMAALDRAPTEWQAARVGWLAGASYFGIALHWIVYPPLVDPERDLWVLPLVVVGLPAALGLFWALGFAVARYTGVRGVARAAAFAICIGSVEWLRSVLLGGFPWALPGYVWVDTPLRNLLPYIGTHGLTFFTFLIPALVWTLSTGGRTSLFSVILRVTAATVIPFVIFATGIVAGIEDTTGRSGTEPPVSVRLVQPNIPQQEKWDEQYRTRNLQRLLRHSISPSGQMPDLVIWPEVALTAVLDRVEPGETEPNLVQVAATSSGSTALILGALTRAADGSRFNSLEITGPKGQNLARYDKRHLVPFGEFLPAQELLTSLGLTTIARGGLTPGTATGRILINGIPPFTALICYEAIFPAEVRQAARGATWLLQITNDAWFGPDAGPRQHFMQTRARAAELGLPLLRVANTGITAIIGADGQVLASLPLGEEGGLEGTLPPPHPGTTVYARYGDLSFLIILLLAGFWCLASQWLLPERDRYAELPQGDDEDRIRRPDSSAGTDTDAMPTGSA